MQIKLYLLDHHQLGQWFEGLSREEKEKILQLLPAPYQESCRQAAEGREQKSLSAVLPEKKTTSAPGRKALSSGLFLARLLMDNPARKLKTLTHGKLVLSGENPPLFCLSHSDSATLLALVREPDAGEISLGADLESCTQRKNQKERHREAIYRRYFPETYFKTYQETLPDDRTEVFLEHWTSLEAVLKAAGSGFATPVEDIPDLFSFWHCRTIQYRDHIITCAGQQITGMTPILVRPEELLGQEEGSAAFDPGILE